MTRRVRISPALVLDRERRYGLPRKQPTDNTACRSRSRTIVGITTIKTDMFVLFGGDGRSKPIKVDSIAPSKVEILCNLILRVAFLQYFRSADNGIVRLRAVALASGMPMCSHKHGSPNAVFPPVQFSYCPRIQADSPRPFSFPRRGAASFIFADLLIPMRAPLRGGFVSV